MGWGVAEGAASAVDQGELVVLEAPLERKKPEAPERAGSVEDPGQIRQVWAAQVLESAQADHLRLGQEAWLRLPASPNHFSVEQA